jgi:hypothetical protein
MLALNVTVSGDKVIIDGLNQLATEMPRVVQRGLKKVVRGVSREAMNFLNGAGGLSSYETRTSKKGNQYQKKTGSKVEMYDGFTRKSGEVQQFKRFTDSGGYPVPVRSGNLKRLLDFLDPGQSKDSFTAGPMEVIVYDSAQYASVIHQGTGSSAKFGKRAFLDDALAKFNQGDAIAITLETELNTEIQKRGLA